MYINIRDKKVHQAVKDLVSICRFAGMTTSRYAEIQYNREQGVYVTCIGRFKEWFDGLHHYPSLKPRPGEAVVTLPEQALVPVTPSCFFVLKNFNDQYELVIDHGKVGELTSTQIIILDRWVKLINATNAFDEFFRTSVHSWPEPQSWLGERWLVDHTVLETRMVRAFLNTRVITADSGTEFVMPILDLFNHSHKNTQGFKETEAPKQLSVLWDNDVSPGKQAFVRYGFYDTVDLYVNYNYFCETEFVMSQAVMIRDGETIIEIGNGNGQTILPEATYTNKTIHVPYLVICSTKQVGLTLSQLRHATGRKDVQKLYASLLTANIKAWKELKERCSENVFMTAERVKTAAFTKLCDLQIMKLQKLQNKMYL